MCSHSQAARAACGSLRQIFQNPLPEKPTLLESLSWNQIKPEKSIDQPSFTEIFGELHFKESSESLSSSSNLSNSLENGISESSLVSSTPRSNQTNNHRKSESFSSLNSESLQLCTEGLGFESSDEVEDMKGEMNVGWDTHSEEVLLKKHFSSEDSLGQCRKSKVCGGDYPPPISSIGRSGKPWVCFRAYRNNGRFVLKEIRVPTQEFLQAYRKDGRLKLHFVQSDDELLEEGDETVQSDDELLEEDETEENYNDDLESMVGGEESRVEEMVIV